MTKERKVTVRYSDYFYRRNGEVLIPNFRISKKRTTFVR